MRIIYVGNFTQPHCTEVHISKTLENMGHQVTRVQEDPRYRRSLVSMAKGHDLFLFTRTWNNLVTLEHLKQLKELGIPTASYHLDLYVGLQREAGLSTDPFWRTEYVFSPDGNENSQRFFKERGINHYYMKPAVFKDECIMHERNSNQELQGDVVFVGGGAEYGHREWPYRHKLVKWLEETYGEKYKKYGHPQKTVRNDELNQLYANAKVVIGDSLSLNFDHPYYWSDRVYETIGRGGFIIHPYIKGMEEEFTDGKDIVFYEFGNFDQLRSKIDYYLANDKEREEIRKAGFELVKEKSTYNNRLQQMINIIEDDKARKKAIANEAIKVISNSPPLLTTPTLKINLGAGTDIKEGFTNVDIVDLPGIDIVHNLMEFPYPFEDNSADEIQAIDVVEHLDNYVYEIEKRFRGGGLTDKLRLKSKPTIPTFVEEMYRILKPGGELFIQVPGWKAEFLWIDPTHVRGFDLQTFDFFDPNTHFGSTTGFYSKAKFTVRKEELPNHNLRFWLTKI